MQPGEWRALVAAFVEGRLSSDAFKRRFLEAFEIAASERSAVPPAVQDLYYVVEAYAGDPMGRGHAVSDDADLRAAAEAALARMPASGPASGPAIEPEPQPAPRVVIFQSAGAGSGARRMGLSFGAIGGLGCFAVLAWLALGVAQFFAVAAQIDAVLNLGPAPSTILALFVAFIPVIGGIVAYFGATDVWGWSWPLAALAFLVGPIATALGGWRLLRRR